MRARRDETGFGVIVLSNPSNVVCTVTASEQDAHSATLERLADRLRDELPGEPSASSTSAEGAFLSARRGQCGAVYGSGGTLATLVGALEPDGVVFRFAPVWVREEEIAAMSATIRERERKRVEQEVALRREREDRKRLDELRDKDREKLRSEQEATLRAQYGAMARAFELSLAKELKDYILVQPSAFARKYQSLARRYEHLKADAWEFMTVETSLFDYGTSEFKGRSLETAFANSRIRLRNRVVGEYKDLCFTTGFISDTEFGVEREPFGVLCEDDAVALERHKQGQKFTSRWLVQ